MSTKNVKFMCTAFRDGFQSVYGARVFDFGCGAQGLFEIGFDVLCENWAVSRLTLRQFGHICGYCRMAGRGHIRRQRNIYR